MDAAPGHTRGSPAKHNPAPARHADTFEPLEPDMPSAYIIANVTVTNPEQYEQYKKLSSIAMQAHGAEVCVRGGKIEVLEGDWTPSRIVVLKFPSVEQARAFNESAEYEAARQSRQGIAVMRMVLVEGV
ncbi:hypothetical protein PMI15_03955 [Polaromonas sp. CF318]|nr:hypothetical protein PMI15_03955 [Polaromonas sp. CF318]